MGSGGRFDSSAYATYADTTRTARAKGDVKATFKSTSLHDELNVKGIKLRESRDSAVNPRSTAIAFFSDVTGSMGSLGQVIVTDLGGVVKQIIDTGAIADPHVMLGAIGDGHYDSAPLQVTQFESEADPLVKQLEKIWVEQGGGGNSFEGYHLAWWFAANRVSMDCFDLRNEKGILFTIGDEFLAKRCTVSEVKKTFGDAMGMEADLDVTDIYAMVSRKFHVFHICVAHVDGTFYDGTTHGQGMIDGPARGGGDAQPWGPVMGQNVIRVKNHEDIADVACATIRSLAGHAVADIVAGMSDSKAIAIREAIAGLPTTTGAGSDGIATL